MDVKADVLLLRRPRGHHNMTLLDLPSDVAVALFEYLTLLSLSRLSLTCHHMHNLVMNFGWKAYFPLHRRFSWSLQCTESSWTTYERVRYDTITARNWGLRNFVARPLCSPWQGTLMPDIAISASRLVVAAGCKLIVYTFMRSPRHGSALPLIHHEATYTLRPDHTDGSTRAQRDITCIKFLSDNGEDRTLLTGFADGYVMIVTLPDIGRHDRDAARKPGHRTVLHYSEHVIASLSVANDLLFALTKHGRGTLRNVRTNISSEIDVKGLSWTSYIPPTACYLALGTGSESPLAIHSLHESGVSPDPHTFLSSRRASSGEISASRESSAVYSISGPTPSFPGPPDRILAAGWYDGCVRLYDLRTPSCSTVKHGGSSGTAAAPVLHPSLVFNDPWAIESIYSISTGGATGHTLAAGASRHSVVAFWDVRAPKEGWSVHAPGNDPSPVYALELESSRVYGATQSRAFALDFGPGVSAETYPQLEPPAPQSSRRVLALYAGLKTFDGLHYSVMHYPHRPMAVVVG